MGIVREPMGKFPETCPLDTVQVFICMERAKDKPLQQIANKTKMKRAAVQTRCRKCEK
ncbi:MAG: hypothetical protein QM642_10255 [Edaphocola sp.]